MSRISCLRQLLCPVQWLPPQWTHRSPTFVHLSVGCSCLHLPHVHSVAWQNFIEWEYSWHFLHSIGLSLYGYTLVIICSPGMSIICGILSLLKVITEAVRCSFLGLIHFASTISHTWYFIFMPCLKERVFSVLKSLCIPAPCSCGTSYGPALCGSVPLVSSSLPISYLLLRYCFG